MDTQRCSAISMASLATVDNTRSSPVSPLDSRFALWTKCVLPSFESGAPVRVWCTSLGEDPFLLAMASVMVAGEEVLDSLEILATDPLRSAVETAHWGFLPSETVATLPQGWQQHFFERPHGRQQSHRRVQPFIREIIRFRQADGGAPHPAWASMDAIFASAGADPQVMEPVLRPGGYWICSPAATGVGLAGFKRLRPGLYRKAGNTLTDRVFH